MSKTTYHIEPVMDHFVIEVRFNDGYTKPQYIGGDFHTREKAQKHLDKYKEAKTIMEGLTLDQLKEMVPHQVIATGEIENSPDGIYMTDANLGHQLRWVAKRGYIHDWAIYIHWAHHSEAYVINHGDKVRSEDHIKKLVPCTDEAFNLYRH